MTSMTTISTIRILSQMTVVVGMDETEHKVTPHHTVVMDKQDSESLYHTENVLSNSTAPTPTTANAVVTSGFDSLSTGQPQTTTGGPFDLHFCELVPQSQPQNSDVFNFNGYNQDYDITPVKDLGTEEYSRVTIQKVELYKTEHPWMRPSKVEGDLSIEERETERLYRKFQGILNKLTPQKFQTLAEQALKLKIDSEQKLNGCADRIIANAIKEPKYSIAYANLYKVMSTIKVESTAENGSAQVVMFRRVVLAKLQWVFEEDKQDDEEREGLLRAIDATQDPERKQQLGDRVKEWDAKSLKWSVGIVHFIGELFKLKMLPETVMHMCFARLLRSSSDNGSLECFTHLVTITGKDVNKLKAKTRMDQYFTRISEIIKKGKIPLRIKFMLQDIQELRANDWIPRRRHQEYSLKTTDQIHFEARIEKEKEKQLVAQSTAGSKKHGRGDKNSRQGYLRSSDWHYGEERRDKNGDRKEYKLQDTRKLQFLLNERDKSGKLPVELHKAEHPWMRSSKVLEGDLSREDRETERLYREFQGILNKLTPQKFQTLAEQALKLKIDSEQRLRGCIDKIFNVVLNDPKYSIAYANLCKVMSTIKVKLLAKEARTKVVTFRRVLLTRVQQEFENTEMSDEEKETMLKTIKETHNPARRRQLEQELKVHEAKNHKQSMNNIHFLGELFKLKMLSETIMHDCIVRLLWSSTNWQLLEDFTVLITTTGKNLDHPDAKTQMDQYFTRISEIIKKGKIPLKIKFMLQDIQDLRANDWISRLGQEQTIKTINQIHHEAKVEEEKRKQQLAQNRTHSDTANSEVIMQKRRVTVQPPGVNFRPLGWQGRTKHKDRDNKKKLDARRLQILLKQREQGVSFKHCTAFTLGNTEKQPAIPAGQCAHQRTGSRGEQRRGQDVMDQLAADRQKTMAIIDELIEDKDLETAVVYLCEMDRSDKMISDAINHSLEKSSHHRQSYGHLFSELVKEQLISKEQFIKGLNIVLECADDIAVDVPEMWNYLAEILSPIISRCALSLSFLSSVPSSLLSSGEAGLLAVKILAHCRKQLSCNDEVATIWATSSLEWSTLGISSEELPKLLSRHDLEYLLGTHQPQPDSLQQLQHVTELTHLLSNLAITTDDIIDWIESHFPTPVLSIPEFVTTMTTAIADASILGSGARYHFQEEIFSLRVVCIRKYVDGDEDLQMRVLYALQLAVDKLEHPPGILNQMFNVIYDLEIVREVVFLKWRDFGSEAFSKGRAILSVKSFFDWLDCGELEL